MTNRLDNMTKDERKDAFREADKIRTNYIISNCCSVDDLRCHLSNMNADTIAERDKLVPQLKEAIIHEQNNQKRVTIIKMLTGKINSINKRVPW